LIKKNADFDRSYRVYFELSLMISDNQ